MGGLTLSPEVLGVPEKFKRSQTQLTHFFHLNKHDRYKVYLRNLRDLRNPETARVFSVGGMVVTSDDFRQKTKEGIGMNGIYTVKLDERTLYFKYTFRTGKALEEEAGISLATIGEVLNKPTLANIEALIKYALIWKNKNMSEDELMDLLDEVSSAGKLDECIEAAAMAYSYFFGGSRAVQAVEAEKKRMMAGTTS